MQSYRSLFSHDRITFILCCLLLAFGVYSPGAAQDIPDMTEEVPPQEVIEDEVPTEVATENAATPEVATETPTAEVTPETTAAPTQEATSEATDEATTEPEATLEPTQEVTTEPEIPGAPPVFNLEQTTFEAIPGQPLTIQLSVSDEMGMARVVEDASATLGGLSLEVSEPLESEAPFITNVLVNYLPPADYAGLDGFTLTAIDAAGETAQVTLSVNVLATEATPEVTPEATVVPEDEVMAAYIVTRAVDDTNPGSLRYAILRSNESVGVLDTITFNIPGTGPHTITPLSELPHIVDPVIIDGYSQPGSSPATANASAVLMIELNGSSAGNVNGLTITTTDTTIQGLVINRFGANGISVNRWNNGANFGGNTVRGNYIGTDLAGNADLGNGGQGVIIWWANENIIGGPNPADRNVLSGNTDAGAWIGGGSRDNTVQGNYIGTNAAGTGAIPNSEGVYLGRAPGAYVNAANNNIIGGTEAGARNLISGNTGYGIEMYGGSSNTVQGNYIGVNVNGTGALGNGNSGIRIGGGSNNLIGGTSAAARNIISANAGSGISIGGDLVYTGGVNNRVFGNYIGTDVTGTTTLGNTGAGVSVTRGSEHLIGGIAAGEGNLISNNGRGVAISGDVNWSPDNVSVRGNRTFNNGDLGIDLFYSWTEPAQGHSQNDPGDTDGGTNSLQNHPVLSSAELDGGNIDFSGSLNSRPNILYLVDYYISAACDGSGYGEGETYLGSTSVTTDGSGNAIISASLPAQTGTCVTATVTDPAGDTSEFSSWVQVVSAPPSPPAGLTATVGVGITLNWSDNATDKTGYEVERSPIGTNNWTQIASLPAGTYAYQDTSITCGTTYSYRVRGLRGAETSIYSNIATAALMICPPTNLAASAVSSTQVNLSWTDISTGETNYYIERSPSGANTWTQVSSLGANAQSYSNFGLTCGTAYDYRVRSFRATGTFYSAYSAVVTSTPMCAPTNGTAVAASTTQINLSWIENIADENGFRVERLVNGVWQEIASIAANETSYSVLGLVCSTSNTFRVRAYRSNDNGFSNYSSNIVGSTAPCPPPPTAPTGLTATAASAARINLAWTDNATDENQYRVERWNGAGWIEIASIGANKKTYVDNGVVCDTTYTFRVRAYRNADGGVFSSYSNLASATTADCGTVTRAPGLTTPANNSSTNDTTPTFVWSSVVNAQNYDIQAATDANFTTLILNITSVANTTYTPGSPLNGGAAGQLYWRARGKNNLGTGPWSRVFRFSIDLTPPTDSPTLTRPANDSFTSDTTPAFAWARFTGATRYQLQLSLNEDCSAPFYTSPELTRTSFTLPNTDVLPGEDVFFWCVRGNDAAGNWGPYSAPFNFGLTLLVKPLNLSSTTDTTPAFSWKSAGRGVTYTLLVDDNADFSSPVLNLPGLTRASYTVPKTAPLAAGVIYHWRVIPSANWTVTEPIVWSFLLVDARLTAPILVTPATGATGQGSTPNLTWNPVAAISGITITYEVQVDNASNLRSPEDTETGLTGTDYQALLPATPGTRFYWRVRAVYNDSVYGPWSRTYNFRQ